MSIGAAECLVIGHRDSGARRNLDPTPYLVAVVPVSDFTAEGMGPLVTGDSLREAVAKLADADDLSSPDALHRWSIGVRLAGGLARADLGHATISAATRFVGEFATLRDAVVAATHAASLRDNEADPS